MGDYFFTIAVIRAKLLFKLRNEVVVKKFNMAELWFKVKYYLMKFAYLKKRSRLRRYGLPICLVFIVFSLAIFLPNNYFKVINSQTVSLLVLILIVVVSSWYGGLGSGIFATILTSVMNYFTLLKEDLAFHSQTGDLVITLLYTTIGLIISIISEARYEAELQKDEFLGLTTHELKNPLTVIKGFTGVIHQYSKKSGNSKIMRFTEEIDLQSDRLLDLINDLLDINKIEVGKFVYNNELFDFDDMVKEVISHQKIINKNRVITLLGSSNKVIDGDRYRLGQVITNFLTNALKYSPTKNSIEVKVKKTKKEVTLAVKDHGVGISKKEQEKIFNQYYRTRATLRGKTEGLGLGLFICKSIIKKHGGKIWVKSDEGTGSTFCFSLPLR